MVNSVLLEFFFFNKLLNYKNVVQKVKTIELIKIQAIEKQTFSDATVYL